MEIVLYQYKICPFCNKIKTFLDFYGLPYTTVEVNPLSKKEIKTNLKELDYKKVPICVINGEIVCDSPVIMKKLQDMLEERGALLESHSSSELGPVQVEQETSTSTSTSTSNPVDWVKWVDTSLAVLLFPNITRNFPESWQAFAYIANVDSFSASDKFMNRVLGPIAMWAAQGKIKKKYDIENEREAMFEAVYKWADAVALGGTFQGGEVPSLADVCVFGCLRSITGLDTHTAVVNDPRISVWYQAMIEAVGDTTEQQ